MRVDLEADKFVAVVDDHDGVDFLAAGGAEGGEAIGENVVRNREYETDNGNEVTARLE